MPTSLLALAAASTFVLIPVGNTPPLIWGVGHNEICIVYVDAPEVRECVSTPEGVGAFTPQACRPFYLSGNGFGAGGLWRSSVIYYRTLAEDINLDCVVGGADMIMLHNKFLKRGDEQ